MKEYESIVFKIEIHYTIVAGAKFPYRISNILCDIFRKPRTVFLKKLDAKKNLFVLYT